MPSQPKLRVTWVRSAIGCTVRQRATVRALGLHRLHQSVLHEDHPAIRGMLHAVRHLLEVHEATDAEIAAASAPRQATPKFTIVKSAAQVAAEAPAKKTPKAAPAKVEEAPAEEAKPVASARSRKAPATRVSPEAAAAAAGETAGTAEPAPQAVAAEVAAGTTAAEAVEGAAEAEAGEEVPAKPRRTRKKAAEVVEESEA
ncbi:MAG: 50S ribosomal protein L30 [Chloroflexi bacterium]|nr:50S ribosomal protein L30 [Chloroflexota bacterium]